MFKKEFLIINPILSNSNALFEFILYWIASCFETSFDTKIDGYSFPSQPVYYCGSPILGADDCSGTFYTAELSGIEHIKFEQVSTPKIFAHVTFDFVRTQATMASKQ